MEIVNNIIQHIYHNYYRSLFNINKRSNSYYLCHKNLLSDFPGYLSMGILLFWSWALWESNR